MRAGQCKGEVIYSLAQTGTCASSGSTDPPGLRQQLGAARRPCSLARRPEGAGNRFVGLLLRRVRARRQQQMAFPMSTLQHLPNGRFGAGGSLQEPNLILPGLFLGSWSAALDRESLQAVGVKHVLQVASGLGPPRFPDEFKYTVVELDDVASADIAAHFERCIRAIEDGRAAGGILVHCMAGVSRSATVVIAYLMKTQGMSMDQALDFVKERRPIIFPNYGFQRQLRQYEKRLQTERETLP